MKMLAVVLFSVLSVSAHATLLLDASCKADCVVSEETDYWDQGGAHVSVKTQVAYFDLSGLSRAEIDAKTEQNALNGVCKAAFTAEARALNFHCLYFKH